MSIDVDDLRDVLPQHFVNRLNCGLSVELPEVMQWVMFDASNAADRAYKEGFTDGQHDARDEVEDDIESAVEDERFRVFELVLAQLELLDDADGPTGRAAIAAVLALQESL